MRFQCPKCGNIVLVGNNDFGTAVQCGSCSSVLTVPESRVSLGAVVGDFIIRQELGRGGMGVVYLAHQISLDRPAALKILADAYVNDAEFVVGFIKEARAAAKLNHPHIVQAYAVGEDEGLFYFAMENIDGETMKSVLKREKIIPVDEAINIIQQIAEALHYAWVEQKLIHRDIKPDNIMLTSNGRAKLADLGLARVAGDIDDNNGDEVMGTPQYISPEHLTGAPMDGRSDIYSLGATFYHFVTGQFPFDGATATEIAQKHLTAPLVPPSQVNPRVPQCVSRIIEKMMAKNPVMRYQDAEALVEDLRIAKKLIEATSTPVLRTKGRSRVDLTAAVTPENITGDRIFSDDTVTRALNSGSLSKTVKRKKSNSDLILLGIVCALILIVVGAIVAVNFAMKKKTVTASKNKTQKESKVIPGKNTNVLNIPDRSKQLEEIINFVKENGKKRKEVRDKCEEFLHEFGAPKTKSEQELYLQVVRYFNRYDEALMKRAREDAVNNHEAKLKKVAEDKKKQDDMNRILKAKKDEWEKAERDRKAKEAAFNKEREEMQADVLKAKVNRMTKLLSCSMNGDFVGAADAAAGLISQYDTLLEKYKDPRLANAIKTQKHAVKKYVDLMDDCADFHDMIRQHYKFPHKIKVQIDGQKALVTEVKDGFVYYEVGKKSLGQRKPLSELIRNHDTAYSDIVVAVAKRDKKDSLLFAYFAYFGDYAAALECAKSLSPEGQSAVERQAGDLTDMLKLVYSHTTDEKIKSKLRKNYEKYFPKLF